MGKTKLTIEQMQKIAEGRGGKCLSTKYINNRTNLTWQCEKGHIWDAIPSNVMRDHWCPICAGNVKNEIKEMQKIATERGGKCLSKEYINAHTKLKWQCKEGHIWKMDYHHIRRGQWCQKCSQGISERFCRQFFEAIFNVKFPTKRPKWLINSRGNVMHLDGFNEKLNLAFEYHGIQHFEYNPHYHNKNKTVEQRKKDDEDKRNLCKLHGVTLIEVPYTIEYNKMQEYIIKQYKIKTGLILNNIPKIDYKKFKIFILSKLEELNEIVKQKGGKLLTTKYINNITKLKWQCEKGHIWEATPKNIKKGRWCPYCAGNIRLTIEDMHKLAEEKNGKCLSIEYINSKTKLKWECQNGHTWEAKPYQIKNMGQWCPVCARKRARKRINNKSETIDKWIN